MKSIIISVVMVVILLVAGLLITKNGSTLVSTETDTPTPNPTLTITPQPTAAGSEETIPQNSKSYNVEWIIVRDLKKISLVSNTAEKLTSVDAMEKYGCVQLINGGFWREDNGEPIGLFITEGEKLHSSVNNELTNGYFYINNNLDFDISLSEPDSTTTRTALQSGPLLFDESKPVSLTAGNNEKARRVVVARTVKGEVVFMVFYYKPSPLTGPTLAELPNLLEDLYKTSNLKVESALNLDGGSHSAFVTDNVRITEVARLGSFFCIKP